MKTSPFNAPRNYSAYGGKVDDRHEGIDIAPVGAAVAYVLAVADGVVESVKVGSGYGNYVTVRSSHNGRQYWTWRAHMASVSVVAGQPVRKGDVLGVCGSTGNSSGRHDHLTMTAIGGLDGYIVPGVIDPTPYYPAPLVASAVDLLPYLRGEHRRQFDMGHNVNGGGTQTVQVWHHAPNGWLYVKGELGEYERLGLMTWNGAEWIARYEDTSESADRFYAHYMTQVGAIGAPWMPRYAVIGRWYDTPKFVQHYHKGDCAKLDSNQVTDHLRLLAGPRPVTYPESLARLDEVITIEWSGGEQYDFAAGRGCVAFRDADRRFWFIGDLNGRPDRTYRKPGCIVLGW